MSRPLSPTHFQSLFAILLACSIMVPPLSNILFCPFNIVQEVNSTLKFTLACLRCCSILNDSLLYVLWLKKRQGKRREYKEHRRKLQSLKAEWTKHGSPLTQTPASMKYLAQGNAALYINLLLIGRPRSHTHLRFMCLAHTGSNYLLTPQNVSLSINPRPDLLMVYWQ